MFHMLDSNQGEYPLHVPQSHHLPSESRLFACIDIYYLVLKMLLLWCCDPSSPLLCLANTHYSTQLGETNLGYKCIFKII